MTLSHAMGGGGHRSTHRKTTQYLKSHSELEYQNPEMKPSPSTVPVHIPVSSPL